MPRPYWGFKNGFKIWPPPSFFPFKPQLYTEQMWRFQNGVKSGSYWLMNGEGGHGDITGCEMEFRMFYWLWLGQEGLVDILRARPGVEDVPGYWSDANDSGQVEPRGFAVILVLSLTAYWLDFWLDWVIWHWGGNSKCWWPSAGWIGGEGRWRSRLYMKMMNSCFVSFVWSSCSLFGVFYYGCT